jgi:polar amino acid transport system substrate-binding protein
MFSTKRSAVIIPLALAALLGMSACTNASAEGTSSPTQAGAAASTDASGTVAVNEAARDLLPAAVKEKGVLVFASDPTYPPFEYMDSDNKTLIGFDISLTDALAESLGLKAQHTAATFDTILPGLGSGKYDVGVSSFSITDERKKAVDFVPYMAGGTGLGVATGNPKKLQLLDNSLCGHAIAAQKGSIQALTQGPEFSKKCTAAGEEPIDIQTFPGQSDANLALLSGRVDAILSDTTSLAYQGQESGGKFEVAEGEDYEPTGVGMAVKKGSELAPALNAAMQELIGSQTYGEVYAEWKIPTSTQLDAASFEKYSK